MCGSTRLEEVDLLLKSGIPLCIAGALSFGLLACAAKLADRRKCDTASLALCLFAWSTLAMLGESERSIGTVHLATRVILLSAVLGACAAIAFLAFQKSMSFGKVVTAWLMMNLFNRSSGARVPVALS